MTLLFVSFLAGVLTTLAPCILPLLPVIIGGSITGTDTKSSIRRPLLIVGSLAVSVIVFTLLLKATTLLLGVPQDVWRWLSGSIVILLGVTYLFPGLWQKLVLLLRLPERTNKAFYRSSAQKSTSGAILTGAALGPVFTSCSPTYFLIVATVLPASFFMGLVYLISYTLGMVSVLLLVVWLGTKLTRKLGWALDEHGMFHKIIGMLFIAIGISVIFALDKDLQAWLLEAGFYDGTSGLEMLFQ
jgi:cytochrome c-type biogenesis protein